MKKITLSVATLALMGISTTYAQLYVKAGVGYNIGNAKNAAYDQTATSQKLNATSFNNGISPIIGIGYMFNKNVGIELAGAYLIGSERKNSQVNGLNSTTTLQYKANALALYPSVKLQTALTSKISLYSRSGLVIPVGGKMIYNSTDVSSFGTEKRTGEIKGSVNVGLSGALGLSVNVNNKLSVWGEVSGQSLKVWAKSGKLTAYTVNGKDQLPLLPVYQKEVNFHKELTSTMNFGSTPNLAKAQDAITSDYNFSGLGIAVGIAFKF